MKRIVLVLALIGLALPLVFAGGSTETAAAAEKSVTIACYDTWYSPVSYTSNPPVWQEIQKKTGIKVVFTVFDDYDNKMNTVIASGKNLPDIMILTPTWSNNGVYKLARDGVIRELDSLIAADAPNVRKLFATNPEVKQTLTAPDGKIYSVADLPLNPLSETLLARQDWITKLGLKNPVNTDDWYQVLKAFKTKDPNGNGQADEIPFSFFGTSFPSRFMASGFALTSDWAADAKNVVTASFVSQDYKAYLTFLNKLYVEGLIDSEKRDEAGLQAASAQNKVGLLWQWIDKAPDYENALRHNGQTAASVQAYTPPQPTDGRKGNYVRRDLTWSHYGIPAASKNADAAMKLIDFVWADPAGLLLKEFGIEGKTYTLGTDGKPQYTDFVLKNPDGLGPMDALRSVGGSPSIFVNDMLEAYGGKYAGTRVLEFTKLLQPTMVSPFPQVMPLDTEIKDITRLRGDIMTYMTEMKEKFIFGQEPLSGFDSYVATLKGMGLDDLTKIYQAQYTRYAAAKK
jgi:putative aldouronate transport system substrate-binding protein